MKNCKFQTLGQPRESVLHSIIIFGLSETSLIDDVYVERRNREIACELRLRVMAVHEERVLIVSLETGRNCPRVQPLTATLLSLMKYLTF